MVPSGIKICKEQLNTLAYADDIVLIGKNEIEIRKLFVEMEKIARILGLQTNQEKTKYMTGKENSLKQNKIGYLKIKIANLKEKKIPNIQELYLMKITTAKQTGKKE